MGYTKQEIKSIPRWDRVRLVMEMANSAKELGAAEDLLRFSRTGRINHASRLVEYRKSCRDIWDKQIRALSNESWEAHDDDDEDVSVPCFSHANRSEFHLILCYIPRGCNYIEF